MSYTLYGSQTSPFVRRIRILLENIPYSFKEINIFDAEDTIELTKVNPINQLPALQDGETTIWDSRQIFSYLNNLHRFQNMEWSDENMLTAIEGATSAGVAILMMKRSGINIDEPYMVVVRHKDRMESILDYLTPYIKGDGLKEWNFISVSLYCYLDWAVFRGLLKIDKRPECQAFLDHYKNLPVVKATEIPKV